jgi:hypothetical protein
MTEFVASDNITYGSKTIEKLWDISTTSGPFAGSSVYTKVNCIAEIKSNVAQK